MYIGEGGRELGLDRSSGEGSGRLQGGAGVAVDEYMTSKEEKGKIKKFRKYENTYCKAVTYMLIYVYNVCTSYTYTQCIHTRFSQVIHGFGGFL